MTHTKDETLRHRIRVHIANREHYSKVEFLDKLHEILHESEQTAAPVQPVAWRFTGIAGFKRFVTDAQHKAFSPEVRAWYEPFKCASCSTPPTQPAPCTWTKSPDPHMPDTFDATCGVVWTFTDGGPAENDVRFCPGCGAAVSVAAPEPEEDLFDLAVKADNGGQP